ncbi:MAG: hypothetical protein AAF993_03695 [Pseudomonadota bacterium]
MTSLQQINLLSDDLLPRAQPLHEKQLLAGCLIFAALLIGWSLLDAFALGGLSDDIDEANRALATLNSQIEELREAQAGGETALRAELTRLRARRAEQSMLAQILNQEGRGSGGEAGAGIASAMVVLAENRLPGLWLSELTIYPRHMPFLQLKGHALDPVMVPRYLQKLADGGRFTGHRFERVEVRRADAQDRVDFELYSPDLGDGG